jgi:hypothetical protein
VARETAEDDFQHLLPGHMRPRWAVVPRFFLYQLFFVGGLLGAGVALTVIGFAYDAHRWMRWGWAVALLVAWLQNVLLSRHERRLVADARRAAPDA